MANTGIKGSSSVQSGTAIVSRIALVDDDGKVVSGTAPTIRFFELQTDGTLKSFDFSDDTFKTGALTTATENMTHRTGNNATYNTGLWTHVQSVLTGFTRGAVYLTEVYHATAAPDGVWNEFTYGEPEGDVLVSASFAAAKTLENAMTGPVTSAEALLIRLGRRWRLLGSKVVRNKTAGTVSIRNDADSANLQVESHSTVSGTVDQIERTT